MTVIDRSALVGHGAQAMFALVADVESYPQFLPWCDRAVVSLREPGRTVATLRVDFHGLKQEFTTENLDQPGARIDMKLVSGPFRSLEGSWSFTGLGENGCKVELSLRYEFSSAILERAIGPVFHGIADGLVEAFVRRAAQKYART
ncbi:MAG TPA: type II toxin-antitoxin system RatA family toxin [Burkholderiales bacterium]|nr:type II toxin-antitoxin system RatA family toxin [Burkholderiales bacterium]